MPVLIATPFATNGTKNDIPETTGAQPQNATMDEGFPAITQQSISTGGIPPERADFNGILYALSDNISHINKGLAYSFDTAFATKIGGYPLHAELVMADGTRVVSTIPNNMNNPDVDLTGWRKGVSASNVIDESGKTQQEVNNDIKKISYANYPDVRTFDVIPDKTTDWTSVILGALATLPESSTFYIPQGVKWAATSNPDAVYAAMPDNGVLIDDSGYESRYTYTDESQRWQASQQIYYKTKDYGAAGRRNGNGLNIRSDYHSYLNYEIDAPFGTGGCKGSIIWRFNNGSPDSAQFGANGDSATMAHIGIATYGTYSAGTTALRIGLQSSIAPSSFIFNNAMVDGVSYVFGKRVQKTNPLHPETTEEWQSTSHVTRITQPNGHTGSFERLYYHYQTLNWREILDNTGRMRYITKNTKTITTTADAEVFGDKLSVLTPTTNTALSESLSGSFYSNVSTGGTLTITLPKAIKGVYFDFSIDVAQSLVIAPNAADNFTGMATGKTKTSNTINSKLRVVAVSATQWAFTQSGTWTDQA